MRLALARDEERAASKTKNEVELPETAIEELPREPEQTKDAAPPKPAPAASESDSDYSLSAFLDRAQTRRKGGRSFELHNDRLLDVSVNGKVWMKAGVMVGYYGIIKFTREGFLEHGLDKLLKKAATGEGAMLTKATGQGNLFLADKGKKISILSLGGNSLVAAGTNLLAFEESVEWDIQFMKQLAAIWSGGLFNVRMSGRGCVAITTHGDPVVLRVTPTEPVMTDVHATVAWSGGLVPQIKTDVAMRSLIGRTSGETLQMRFQGDGFVIIQPYEEIPGAPASSAA